MAEDTGAEAKAARPGAWLIEHASDEPPANSSTGKNETRSGTDKVRTVQASRTYENQEG